MKKNNNKGFTLVELIISMSILTIVLGLGYNIINGTNIASKNQLKVFSEQQNANLIHKYLTKDLEQVREFTTADTTLNPYKYIINEDTEPVEYEISKTSDGKHYSITRKTSTGSIEIVSNQPTNSDIPFSIERASSSSNIFRVTLNGKGKDSDFEKYEFEVTSRVGNIASVEGTPIPPEGGNGGDDGDGGNGENPGDVDKSPLDGELRIIFGEHNWKWDDVTVFAKASIKDTDYKEEREDTHLKISKPEVYTIKAKIPIKNSDHLGVSVTNCRWNKEDSFGGKWDIFKEKLISDGIEIYAGTGIKISSFKIDGKEVPPIDDETNSQGKTYYFDLTDTNKETVLVEIKLNINNYSSESLMTIGFGNYKNNSNAK